ncbi:MAG: PorT family protein [Paludibacteraceae bacterium]|nr:PorT family protein [Paludibacteraceae bacterium]
MRKCLIMSLVALFGWGSSVSAQTTKNVANNTEDVVVKPQDTELAPEECLYEPRFTRVDAHAGINLSDYSSDYLSTGLKPGFNVGIGFDFPFKRHYSINPELNFSMVGAKVDFTDKINGSENLCYMEIPVYSKWEFGNGKVKPFIAFAPTLGVGIIGSRNYDGAVLYKDPHNKNNVEDKKVPLFAPNQDVEFEEAVYKKLDFGFKFKVGVTTVLGFMAYAGYQLGMVDLARDDFYKAYGKKVYGSDETIGVSNKNIFVSVGYCW